ncbi:MAG TPA: hypothetical protein VGR94_02765 [Candidatus Acidoferrales bacterium]|nr:hypothetical protein [Candidatus Acidoferrales bacterium]
MTNWDINTTFIERMKDARPLTFSDFREMLDWLKKTYEIRAIDMLQLRVAIQLDQTLGETRRAIERFDDSSRKLTRWLIRLTVILVILTVVIAGFTILLWRRG